MDTVTISKDHYNAMSEAIMLTRHAMERNQSFYDKNIYNKLGDVMSVADCLDEALHYMEASDLDAHTRMID